MYKLFYSRGDPREGPKGNDKDPKEEGRGNVQMYKLFLKRLCCTKIYNFRRPRKSYKCTNFFISAADPRPYQPNRLETCGKRRRKCTTKLTVGRLAELYNVQTFLFPRPPRAGFSMPCGGHSQGNPTTAVASFTK